MARNENQDFTNTVASMLVDAAQDNPPEGAEEPVEPQEGQTEGEGTPEAQEPPEELLQDLNPELPEDLAEELAAAEAETEEPEVEEEDEEDTAYDAWDDETKKLQKQLKKLQKREKFLEDQVARTGAKSWRVEAEKYFPLASGALDSIKAKTRREYLRQAKQIHEQFVPSYEQLKHAYTAAIKQEREKIEAQVKEEMKGAWGESTVVPDRGAEIAQARESLQTRRKSRSLANIIGERLKDGSHVRG